MKKILQFLSSCSGLLLLVAGCSNFYLAFRASSVVNSVCVTNYVEVASIPTNSVPLSVSVPTNSPSLPVSSPVREDKHEPRQVAEYPYQYFLVGRTIGAQMFGRYYYDGSLCSYGRIDKIFPDRILLENGDWIMNRLERRTDLEPRKKEIARNDR